MKARKLQLLEAAKVSGLFDMARRRSAKGVRILNYHGIWTSPEPFSGDSMFMTPGFFARRLDLIRTWGYAVVPLDEAIAGLAGKRRLPPNAAVITIDDGWYSTYQHMIPALQQRGMPATLYCDTAHLDIEGPVPHVAAMYFLMLADARTNKTRRNSTVEQPLAAIATDRSRSYADRMDATEKLAKLLGFDFQAHVAARSFDYMTPAELRTMLQRPGFNVELHTHNHTLHDMSAASIAQEITLNRAALSRITGQPATNFTHFCYPSGVYTKSAGDVLRSLGIKSATTTKQAIATQSSCLYALPRVCDNEMLTEIEFEAELSGFSDWLRMSRFVLPTRGTRNRQSTIVTELATVALS